jgi:predicted  nucleic acid-binding Zn-ribbon protein
VVQSQLDDLRREVKRLETEILKAQSESQTLQDTISTLEIRLADQEVTFTKEKEALHEAIEQSLESRLKEEKVKWEDEQLLYAPPPLSATFSHFAGASPMSPRNPSRNFKSVSPQPDHTKPRFPSRNTSFAEIPHIRRTSRPLGNPFDNTSFTTLNIHIPPPEDDDERDFLSPSRGESPRNTVADAVSVSASTTTAGPNINIIERMSAAVRRLETDLAATKEEMARSVKQRDEAREECVKLMVEVEEKRALQTSVGQLHSKYDDLENRYATSRNMLMAGITRLCCYWGKSRRGWRN